MLKDQRTFYYNTKKLYTKYNLFNLLIYIRYRYTLKYFVEKCKEVVYCRTKLNLTK